MVLNGFPTVLGGKTTFEILVIARLKLVAKKNFWLNFKNLLSRGFGSYSAASPPQIVISATGDLWLQCFSVYCVGARVGCSYACVRACISAESARWGGVGAFYFTAIISATEETHWTCRLDTLGWGSELSLSLSHCYISDWRESERVVINNRD